jgi:large subunit ribosomal protein L15
MAEKKNDDVTAEAEVAPEVTEAKKPARKAPAKKAAAPAADAATAEKAPAKKAPARKPATAKADATVEAEAAPAASKAPKATAKKAAANEAEVGAGGTLKLHHLRPAPGAKTAKTRVGRGEASKGKTAGRGTKGTKARYQVPAGFEGGQMPLHMRLPKLRGFKNPFRTEYQVVNLDKLSALYPEGGAVTVSDLVAKGAVRKGQLVKVLGTGELSVKLDVTVDALSGSAKDKILAAGGTVSED